MPHGINISCTLWMVSVAPIWLLWIYSHLVNVSANPLEIGGKIYRNRAPGWSLLWSDLYGARMGWGINPRHIFNSYRHPWLQIPSSRHLQHLSYQDIVNSSYISTDLEQFKGHHSYKTVRTPQYPVYIWNEDGSSLRYFAGSMLDDGYCSYRHQCVGCDSYSYAPVTWTF